ncbi:unnamed protein product [Lathyrus sativus]|nr:unnamed protein product [Lathyrus sativus]
MGKMLPNIINLSQVAFVPGQIIHNHIMLAYELLKGYTRKGGTPRAMIQLNLQKACDMMDWHALETVLREMGIPSRFTSWIMKMVTTATYTFSVNGEPTDVMQAKRRIRQGRLISPMLFVVVMEYLISLLAKMQLDPNFNSHAKCERRGITHLTFADDILLFCRGDVVSVEMLLNTVKNLSTATSLIMNPSKCNIYFGGTDRDARNKMQEITNFKEGQLPVRYFDVPLTYKKLHTNHYLPLIDRIMTRIRY